jgi:hypothetical protein
LKDETTTVSHLSCKVVASAVIHNEIDDDDDDDDDDVYS